MTAVLPTPFAFYGDDFTGSTDVMEALCLAGVPTALYLQPPDAAELARRPELLAYGVAGVSRSWSPNQMETRLTPILTALAGAKLIHYKICSTFDSSPEIGSIGRVIEIGRRLFPGAAIPIVVGAPPLGRYCAFGNLFARYRIDEPYEIYRLDRHPTMNRHPVTPMQESDLIRHLSQQAPGLSLGLVNLLHLQDGARAEQELDRLRGHADAILFDTVSPEDMITVGRLILREAERAARLFVVASSGLEYAITACLTALGVLPPPPEFRAEPVDRIVVVSGSASPVTAKQIAHARANGFGSIALDLIPLLEAGEKGEIEAVDRAVMSLSSRPGVVLHTAEGREDPRIEATQRLLADRRADSGYEIGALLGRLLRRICERTGVRRTVVTGGDTCGYAAHAMGLESLEMVCPMAPGSPLCRVRAPGSSCDGMEILFKGGQVGTEDLFERVRAGGYQPISERTQEGAR